MPVKFEGVTLKCIRKLCIGGVYLFQKPDTVSTNDYMVVKTINTNDMTFNSIGTERLFYELTQSEGLTCLPEYYGLSDCGNFMFIEYLPEHYQEFNQSTGLRTNEFIEIIKAYLSLKPTLSKLASMYSEHFPRWPNNEKMPIFKRMFESRVKRLLIEFPEYSTTKVRNLYTDTNAVNPELLLKVLTENVSLIHGDLRANNICKAGHDIRIFDWEGASLSNPMLEIIYFLGQSVEKDCIAEAYTKLMQLPEMAEFSDTHPETRRTLLAMSLMYPANIMLTQDLEKMELGNVILARMAKLAEVI